MPSQQKLNGYYGDDFDKKQEVIKDLLLNKKVSYDDLDLLMDGILNKFCVRISNSLYYWTCWDPKFNLENL